MVKKRSNFEVAISAGSHLILIGWLDDSAVAVHSLSIARGDDEVTEFALDRTALGVHLERTFRLEVHAYLELDARLSTRLGVVLAVPFANVAGDSLHIAFDQGERALQTVIVNDIGAAGKLLRPLLTHSGRALRQIAEKLSASAIVWSIDNLEAQRIAEASHRSLAVDSALLFCGTALIVHGWIGAPAERISGVRVIGACDAFDVSAKLVRTYRPDIFPMFRELIPEALGFLLILDLGEFPELPSLSLQVDVDQTVWSVNFQPKAGSWMECLESIKTGPHLRGPLIERLRASSGVRSLPAADTSLSWLERESFISMAGALPRAVESDASTHAAVDRVISCGDDTLLVTGWHVQPMARLVAMKLCSSDGNELDVTGRLIHFSRPDVTDAFSKRIPRLPADCGFIFCAQVPASAPSLKALRLELDNGSVEWLRVEANEFVSNGEALLNLLGDTVVDLTRATTAVCRFFDAGFGRAIERMGHGRTLHDHVIERQFGEAPRWPDVSVVVPLYGRCDFLRHQLAQFADDPDFQCFDLIYIVDDPRIVLETLALAAHYSDLFRVPFRVVHYGSNKGFAGANNVGAKLARASKLLLLNSDVLPKEIGWVRLLSEALQTLPDAVAVGPLLLFADGSVQHGGMYPLSDPAQPGILWNSHPGKGLKWTQGEQPLMCPMLTAACLMLRTQDYHDCGGLDEGYMTGDFEDSDLSLKLRISGRKLWLAPRVQLWHLERQSLNIGTASAQRQMTTLYNGWRYSAKVAQGTLADPFSN